MSLRTILSAPRQLPALSGRTVLLALLGATVIQVAVGRLMQIGLAAADIDSRLGTGFALGLIVVPLFAALVWIYFCAVWREPAGWAGLGFHPLSERWIAASAVIGLLCVGMAALITAVTGPVLGQPQGSPMPIRAPGDGPSIAFVASLALGAVALGPLFEEVAFRGLLFGWLRQRLRGTFLAAAMAALLHAAIHLDPAAIPAFTAVFFVFALLYRVSGSLWAPTVAHFAHNALVLSGMLMNPRVVELS